MRDTNLEPLDQSMAFEPQAGTLAKNFMANVFMWMFAALAISGFVAFYVAGNAEILNMLISETGGLNLLGYAVMFAPLAFVLVMSFGLHKLSYSVLLLLFIAYSFVNGVSFSFILLSYTAGSVAACFASAAVMFAIMAIAGYTTQQDLTKFGSIMIMGLIGILVASLVNFFLKSDTMDYIISFVGVLVFTGLTAYDVQKLKHIGMVSEPGAEATKKATVMGALNLYLDFVNLFIMLLRLFGGRRD
jgi:uncharacterized protein